MNINETEVRHTIHDLNNALTVMLSGSELILADSRPESQTGKDAKMIQDAAVKARDLVARLRSELGLP